VSDDHFLARWSRRKHAANRGGEPQEPAEPQHAQAIVPAPAEAPAAPPAPLPPVDAITAETDVSGFLKPEVDPALRQAALKKFFRDPRFNVMDGLDVYIDDYSKPDPLPEEWLSKLNQLSHLGDVPAREAEKAAAAQKALEQAQVDAKTEEQQQVAPTPADHSSDTDDKETPPPEVRQS
jgi:hypothetical protein